MPKTYSIEKELTDFVEKLLLNSEIVGLSPLRDHKVKVAACFVIDTDDDGEAKAGKGAPVVLKKVGEVERTFVKDRAQFILVVDYHAWNSWNEKLRHAYLYEELISISVEKTEKGIKIKRVPHDVNTHVSSMALFGPYTKPLQDLVEAYANKGHRVDHLFDLAATGGHQPEPELEESHIKTAEEVLGEEPEAEPEAEPPGPRKPNLKKKR